MLAHLSRSSVRVKPDNRQNKRASKSSEPSEAKEGEERREGHRTYVGGGFNADEVEGEEDAEEDEEDDEEDEDEDEDEEDEDEDAPTSPPPISPSSKYPQAACPRGPPPWPDHVYCYERHSPPTQSRLGYELYMIKYCSARKHYWNNRIEKLTVCAVSLILMMCM